MRSYPVYFLSLAFLLLSCGKEKAVRTIPDTVIPVKVLNLQKENRHPAYNVSGQFTTEDEANLSFKNGGIVRTIYVREGDAVKEGQLLAVLDMTEINALTSQAEIALSKAERDYSRASNLYRDSVATLEQMQNAQTALDIARQQAVNARFNRQTAVIRATRSGYVLRKYAQEGQIVGPGTPILQINGASKGDWVLKAGVSDVQWAAIQTGDRATITTDAYPQKKINGRVTRKSEGSDPMTGTFTVTIAVEGTNHEGIAAGLFGKAEVTGSRQQSVWAVPFSALLDSDRSRGFVFAVSDGNRARKVPVTIERIENKNVIISAGLEDYGQIILEGNAYLTDGSEISIAR